MTAPVSPSPSPAAILVVGGGIAGMQAALDVAAAGRRVYLLEAGPSIGGRMAQLDKTFPTNDCALCILSPKLVEVARHPNISLLTSSDLLVLEGEAGAFTARIRRRPRYVDEERCIGCGLCSEACPVRIPDRYNEGLAETANIRIPFAQAVPKKAVIDAATCLRLQHGEKVCGKCVEACEAGAIDFSQTEQTEELQVAGVILAMGANPFDARLLPQFGYRLYPDVVTSIEYERILSASGPWGGEIRRPSTGGHPQKIAFLQCIGSRQQQTGGRYCSSICCMQATKDAIISREHAPEAEVTIFFMELRTPGKGFDRYVARAQEEYGVRYVRSRVSHVERRAADGRLLVSYETTAGGRRQEAFDLVVLSLGLAISPRVQELCRRIGVALDPFGFVQTDETTPLATSRPGVFVCGTLSGPKDIPATVMEASGAAAQFVYPERGERPAPAPITPPRSLFADEPRVGVFVCHCGKNIAATVDVADVASYAATLPNVLFAAHLTYTCSDDAQARIRTAIREHDLNRIVVAACSPRTHEGLFQATLKEAGLNPYLFEMANIRDQCSWVHSRVARDATTKSRELVRMAVSRVRVREPLGEIPLAITDRALVLGGGLAGMEAARSLARLGFAVDLVERQERLGGLLREVPFLPSGGRTRDFLDRLERELAMSPRVHLHLASRLAEVSGYLGNFRSRIATPEGDQEISHGITVVATGGERPRPAEYGLDRDPYVLTQDDLERRLAGSHPDLRLLDRLVMILCVGSRTPERPYCSVVCCPQALRNAIRLKERFPSLDVTILFRELRSAGKDELLFEEARRRGVLFIRFPDGSPPQVERQGEELQVTVADATFGETLTLAADTVVLSQPLAPNPDNAWLGPLLKVPLDQDRFFLEAHVKLRPVDFATDGIFLCGLAQGPKGIADTIRQADAAATRAATLLGKSVVLVEGKTSVINPRLCNGCRQCVEACPYRAIAMDDKKGVAVVNQALCKGCGICAAACRSGAPDLGGFSNEELASAIGAFLAEELQSP
ncbi:MAG: FAD-dependent oxidoreductase [Thermodesulfobacteriota bacterium]